MKPFLAGRPSVDVPALRPTGGGPEEAASQVPSALRLPASAASPSKHGHGPASANGPGPTVECVKQGDKVVRLIITCACGERTEVECIYPAGG